MLIQFQATRVELVSGENIFVNGTVTCQPGDRILLLGENGVGKSTALLLLHSAASKPPFGEKEQTYGHIHQIDWDSLSVTDTEKFTSSYVFQEPRQNFICRASSDELILPFLEHRHTAEDIVNKLEDLIDAADIYQKQFWRRGIDTLSSGEQQRVAVSAALASEPTLLLLDEALARVDDRSAERLVTLLNKTYPRGIVIASTHRPALYLKLFGDTTRSIINCTRTGNKIQLEQKMLDASLHVYPSINFAQRPLWQKYIADPPTVVRLFNNGMRLFSGHAETMIQLEDLEFTAKLSRLPLATLRSGNIHKGLNFVVGKSGSGKTLLLKLLTGHIRLNPFFSGGAQVTASSTLPINKLGTFASLRKAGNSVFLPAEPFRWLTEQSIGTELSFFHQNDEFQRRCKILEPLGISSQDNPDYLSYGQKKLLALLAIPDRCELVCLDEPFADLGSEYIDITEKFITNQIDSSKWNVVVMSHSSDINIQESIA